MATARVVIFRAAGLGALVGSLAGTVYGASCGLFIGAMTDPSTSIGQLVSVGSYGFALGAGAGIGLGLLVGVITLHQRGRSHAGERVRTVVTAMLWTSGAAGLAGGLSLLLQPGTEAAFLAALLAITLPAWIAAMLGWKLIAPFVDRYSSSTSLSPASSR